MLQWLDPGHDCTSPTLLRSLPQTCRLDIPLSCHFHTMAPDERPPPAGTSAALRRKINKAASKGVQRARREGDKAIKAAQDKKRKDVAQAKKLQQKVNQGWWTPWPDTMVSAFLYVHLPQACRSSTIPFARDRAAGRQTSLQGGKRLLVSCCRSVLCSRPPACSCQPALDAIMPGLSNRLEAVDAVDNYWLHRHHVRSNLDTLGSALPTSLGYGARCADWLLNHG